MPDIRVDPPSLRQAAAKLSEAADRTRKLAEEAAESAASAPSYDGQFGNQVQSMGSEAYAQMTVVATKLSVLSDALLLKAEEFEAADLQSQTAFARIQLSLQEWLRAASSYQPLANFANMIGMGWLLDKALAADGEAEEALPWWAPLALQAANLWHGFDQRFGQPLREALLSAPKTWSGIGASAETIELYHTARGWFWYDRSVNLPLYDLYGRLLAPQGPGLPPGGPITLSLREMAAVDTNGVPISPVGSELVDLVDDLGIRVAFITGGDGVAPWTGQIVLPTAYTGTGQIDGNTAVIQTGRVGLVGHELTHAVHRELQHLLYSPPVIDSTNHMEVVAYIVGETVQYDLLEARLSDPTLPERQRFPIEVAQQSLANHLATYTGSDQLNANRYMLQEHSTSLIYRLNHFRESLIPGHRIPPGGWEQSLRDIGFSDAAIDHIKNVASNGTAQVVGPGEIGLLGDVRTPTPTPTPTLTPTPSPTTAHTPTATATQTPAPTTTPTPSATPSPSSTPTPTSTPTHDP